MSMEKYVFRLWICRWAGCPPWACHLPPGASRLAWACPWQVHMRTSPVTKVLFTSLVPAHLLSCHYLSKSHRWTQSQRGCDVLHFLSGRDCKAPWQSVDTGRWEELGLSKVSWPRSQVPAAKLPLSLPSCMAVNTWLSLSEPQFSPL